MRELQVALFRVLKSLVFRGDPNSPLNELPLSQLGCLHTVAEMEGVKMLDVCRRMELKLPAVSRVVARLVQRGLLQRQSDESDRRVVRLYLTERAREIMGEAQSMRHSRMRATFANIASGKADGITRALSVLAEAAEKVVEEERSQAPALSPDSDPLVEMISRRARTARRGLAGVSPVA
jgi:DNA-binding MarR family transcriptional regulator